MTEERVKQIEERIRLKKELSTKENIIKKFQEKQELIDDHCTWEVRHEKITGLVEFVNPNKELAPCFDSRYYSLNECYINPKDNELHVSPMSIGGVLFGPYPNEKQLKEYNDSCCMEDGKIKCIHLADGSMVLPAKEENIEVMIDNSEIEELKNILFEIYSAGYIDGHDGLVDIQTGYEKWFDIMKKNLYIK